MNTGVLVRAIVLMSIPVLLFYADTRTIHVISPCSLVNDLYPFLLSKNGLCKVHTRNVEPRPALIEATLALPTLKAFFLNSP